MKTFEKMESRYIFNGELMLDKAMHVGSGIGNEETDSLFAHSGKKLYIPGSSLRGALRSTIERIAYGLNPTGNVTCLLSESSDSSCITINKDTGKKYKEKIEDPKATESDYKKFLEEDGHLCDMCKVFGSTHFASKVKITDLYPVDGLDPEKAIRRNVGIDRDTETASQAALFDMEVVNQGSVFEFEMVAENMDATDWGLLCIGLWELMRKNGTFYIGAKSAAGLGRCHLKNVEIQYFDGKAGLLKYLESGKMPEKKECNAAKEFIKGRISAYLSNGGDQDAEAGS